jgi:subtilisin family serine protease
MRSADARRSLLRTARFEACEERLMLSAQPIASAFSSDLWLDDSTVGLPQAQIGNVETSLADVHDAYGVSYVRNTFGFDGDGQTVAVIDSGIAWDHYALGGGFGDGYQVVGGWDFTEENDANPYDDGPAGFHGTHVAGIIGSNDGQYMGVAPGVDLVALRVFNDQGSGYFSWIESALDWVHEHRNDFANPITTVNLSLGTEYNSDQLPNWAMLEDEFAQLRNDGVFISVAAGNSFQSYGEAGLSYPAVSPYVVPVSSVTNSGSFSSFSQRDDRVLAAPGQSITSTVPDYLFDFNGVTDDFATASGTSMAAPYAAGASTLVRQAMEFVGYEDVDQQDIYDHLYDTADVFYDSTTNAYYHRINLQSALDSLMPEDDFGSTIGDAHSLGTIAGDANFGGLIGTLTDTDYFTFTAGQSGEMTLSLTGTHDLAARWRLDGGDAVIGDTLTFDVVQGQQYTLSLETTDGIGRYDVDVELTSTIVDWGKVSYATYNEAGAVAGERWFQMTAQRDGYMSLQANFDPSAGSVSLEIFNEHGQLISGGSTNASGARVDWVADGNETYFVKVVGDTANVEYQVANLISINGSVATVHGTAGDDAFAFVAGDTLRVTANDIQYVFARGDITKVTFLGGGGDDSIRLTGSSAEDTARISVGRATLAGDDYLAVATDVEDVRVFGGGGFDRVFFYDSAGDDRFIARATNGLSYMDGDGFFHLARGFEDVRALALNGGADRAWLFDSAGDDQFVAHAENGLGYMNGEGYFHLTRGFDQIRAIANSGGADRAWLFDSAGDDRFIARAQLDDAYMRGDGFFNYARGFDRAAGISQNGGDDLAIFHDSTGNDHYVARANLNDAYMRGDGFFNYARGFDRAVAFANHGGVDRATYIDSAGNDAFYSRADDAFLIGGGSFYRSIGFNSINAMAVNGGDDQAFVQGVVARDEVFGRGDYLKVIRDAGTARMNGFESINAIADGEDSPSADVEAVDYLFQLFGTWDL